MPASKPETPWSRVGMAAVSVLFVLGAYAITVWWLR